MAGFLDWPFNRLAIGSAGPKRPAAAAVRVMDDGESIGNRIVFFSISTCVDFIFIFNGKRKFKEIEVRNVFFFFQIDFQYFCEFLKIVLLELN